MWKAIRKWFSVFGVKLDQKAGKALDEREQLDLIMAEHQERHRALMNRAGAVVGNMHEARMDLSRIERELSDTTMAMESYLVLQREAGNSGNTQKAVEMGDLALRMAQHLGSLEATRDETVEHAVRCADEAVKAKEAVEKNLANIQSFTIEKQHLLSQLRQAEFAESMKESLTLPGSMGDFGKIQAGIQGRYAQAIGVGEMFAAGQPIDPVREVRRVSAETTARERLSEASARLQLGGLAQQASIEEGETE